MADNVGGIEYTIEAKVDELLRANKRVDSSLAKIDSRLNKTAVASKKFDGALTKAASSVKAVTGAAKVGTTVIASMAVALGAIVAKAASSARELSVMAQLSGVTVERFQELAFGARAVGVSTEKLGDIFKDVQDKIGDFINTGGGELKDYFENIAPLVGQTAKEFKGLSGPDALIKFQKGLDAANISASEQIFYLESLANDAAILSPLLANNAKGFNDSAKRAKELGLVLSQLEVDELVQVNKQFGELFGTIGTVAQKVVADFAPTIIEALKSITNFIQKTGVAVEDFFDLFQDAKNVDNIETLENRLKDLIKSREALNSTGAADGVGRSANAARIRLKMLDEEIKSVGDRLRKLSTTKIEINKGAGQDLGVEQTTMGVVNFNKIDTSNLPSVFDNGATIGSGESVSPMNASLQDGLSISAQMAAQIEELDAKFQNMGTTIGDTLVGSALTFGDTIGNAFASAIASGETLNETFRSIAGTIVQQVLAQLISVGVQYGINAALKSRADATMAASGVAATATQAQASVAASAEVAAAAAPAAAATSIWSFGSAAAVGGAALVGAYALSKSLSGGRLNGGSVSPNSAYQVTENGKPEMLTVGGKNILMTGSQGGMVTSNKDLTSGSGGGNIVINNYASDQVDISARKNGNGYDIEVIKKQISNDIAGQISNKQGPVYKSIKGM